MESKHRKSLRRKRHRKCRGAEHQMQERQEDGSEEQKAVTEIEEMTLPDVRKSHRVVVEGSCNNANYWTTCDQPSFVLSMEKDTKHAITSSMFLKYSDFQCSFNVTVHVFEEYALVSTEKIHINVLPQLGKYPDFNEMQYDRQKDLIYRDVYNYIFRGVYRSTSVAINKLKTVNEQIDDLESLRAAAEKETDCQRHDSIFGQNDSTLRAELRTKYENAVEGGGARSSRMTSSTSPSCRRT